METSITLIALTRYNKYNKEFEFPDIAHEMFLSDDISFEELAECVRIVIMGDEIDLDEKNFDNKHDFN